MSVEEGNSHQIHPYHSQYVETALHCFLCYVEGCQQHFYHHSYLIHHLEVIHGVQVGMSWWYSIALYLRFIRWLNCLLQSLRLDHDSSTPVLARKQLLHEFTKQVMCLTFAPRENKEFASWSEFLQWKDKEETENYCYFAKPTATKSKWTCCRDGQYRHNAAQRKTTQLRKRAGSHKMGKANYCLANITVTKGAESRKVVANYIATHTNHQPEAVQAPPTSWCC